MPCYDPRHRPPPSDAPYVTHKCPACGLEVQYVTVTGTETVTFPIIDDPMPPIPDEIRHARLHVVHCKVIG